MVIGAIEVPRDGKPIVLGPEHPTTGGYPIIAVVVHEDLSALFSIRLGGAVRFTRLSEMQRDQRGT
jgi:allophanate hydrolase subunit 2